MSKDSDTTAVNLALPTSGGNNVAGNPLWMLHTSRTVIEADQSLAAGEPRVRIHELLGHSLGGFPCSADDVEAAGLALIAAARAARLVHE
ncbi:MAG: hypothetical protein DI630_00920 [Gordonia sp. (in: high G+C Gram-positive bacteria)]|nr:MAG: hypothetical protein DI630_00920 [Gordonia sp. (in: high G+C Gram-positive bacteria)]